MASENETATSSDPSTFTENLVDSTNTTTISRFIPFISSLNDSTPPQETDGTENQGTSIEPSHRIVLVDPITQGMVVLEGRRSNNRYNSSLGFDSLFHDLFPPLIGHRPASDASIDAMETLEITDGETDEGQCVICLEEWEAGEKAREMPCKHRFHGQCIEKWLKIQGSCPACRYEMPVDEGDDEKRRGGESGRWRRRTEIWVSLTFDRDRNSGGDQ